MEPGTLLFLGGFIILPLLIAAWALWMYWRMRSSEIPAQGEDKKPVRFQKVHTHDEFADQGFSAATSGDSGGSVKSQDTDELPLVFSARRFYLPAYRGRSGGIVRRVHRRHR